MRGGNELKTLKFHQILHVVDYIQKHGCTMNYDGSRGEKLERPRSKIMLSAQINRSIPFTITLVRE